MSEHDKLREAIRTARSRTSYAADRDLVDALQVVYAAAESTLPKTKMVEVWHVEFCDEDAEPCVTVCGDKVIAEARALAIHGGVATCIRVTGPHQHEVPA